MSYLTELDFIQYSRLDVTKHNMAEGVYEKFLIGFYKDGNQKEFAITFYKENGFNAVKLEADSKAWDLLNAGSDLLPHLHELSGGNIKPEDIYQLLIGLGLRDITEQMNNPLV